MNNMEYRGPCRSAWLFLYAKTEKGGSDHELWRGIGGSESRKEGKGKNQYIELATNISYTDAKGSVVNCEHDAIGNKAIAFVGTSGVQMGWLASQADMLAEDWEVVA